ncbi:hypothetical protein FT663_04480 [Candidozyma haemuli var. vulneris]|uniref:Pre-rRNA-processing protein n=1 Tax=Candidozyma haemuli TaxID=45357 RepID=A0A2V1APQ0_9ASCO|nr:hypothetical protein CXQ85_001829 [[Candida] haemuloni]KAF3987385.1 hypothetical protein FT663_04480 [[Candida] haemuloni var. vulneris]KAF3993151.1 hypothetical protein FT662_00779 [[Candida] haemuloni var. vulneris]PVH20050.1 hypothetical protein CXQ85_001829 [[Candida] haemuloni]
MGSKRKKQEKKKDFQKAKLKVGKTAKKPDNYTDTSFTAKAISLPNQSVTKKTTTSSGPVDLSHHISLTKHHSAQTRKEVLGFIENHLPSNPSLYKQIITATVPLITDSNQGVRSALISLIRACANKQSGLLELHMRAIVLFLNSAMTHIQPDIRASSTSLLAVLVDLAPEPLVKGYFVKIMKSYFSLMSWPLTGDRKAVSLAVNSNGSLGGGKKSRAQHIKVLAQFLDAALSDEAVKKSAFLTDWSDVILPHPSTPNLLLPQTPQAFAHYKFFVDELPSSTSASVSKNTEDGVYSLREAESMSTNDIQTRQKIMNDVFAEGVLKNLQNAVKEGGEIGAEANGCIATIEKLKASLESKKEDN